MKRAHPVAAGVVGAFAALVLFATVPWVRSCALGVARGAACCTLGSPHSARIRRAYERQYPYAVSSPR